MKYIIFDTEVFIHDWLVVFKLYGEDNYYTVHNDCRKVIKFFKAHKDDIFVSFNGKNYDQFIVKAICNNAPPETVKNVNDWIIADGNTGWSHPWLKTKPKFTFNHCDLMDDCQVGTSLKSFEAHSGMNIEETSVDFNINRELTEEELEQTEFYCKWDVAATEKLFDVRSAYIKNKISVGNLAGLTEAESVGLTNAKLTAKVLQAKKQEHYDEREYKYPDNLKREYINPKIFEFFDRMYDPSLSDDEVFNSKLEIEIGGCPTTVAYGGIHSSLLNYEEGDAV